jgi:hypothetical protein
VARLIYLLRVRPERGVVDVIRSLRAWLKQGLRAHGLRCVEICEENGSETRRAIGSAIDQETNDMPVIDLNDAETRTPIPDGAYQLAIKVKPGNAGPDGLLTVAKNMRSQMLKLEYTVLAEVKHKALAPTEHAKRKIFDYITVDYDEQDYGDEADMLPVETGDRLEKMRNSVRMGRAKLRAIIDSAFALLPNDKSEATQQKRRLESYADLDQLRFYADVRTRPGNNGYGPSNTVDYILTCDLPDYPSSVGKAVAPASKPSPKPLRDEMEDEIKF